MNMALDNYLAQNIRENDHPVLRFYGWQPFCMSLGFHQNIKDLNLNKLYRDGFEAVRRPTGGSAIFHAWELTYSLIIPKPFTDHHTIFHDFHAILVEALRKSGYPVELHNQNENEGYLNRGAETFACFNRSAFTEINYGRKKVVGSAQKIFQNVLLQHGSIMIGNAHHKIVDYLSGDNDRIQKYKKRLINSSSCLNEINGRNITATELSEKIINEVALKGKNSIYSKHLTEKELKGAENFAHTFMITGKFLI